ncbi:MAG: HemK family protein methyltransferase [Candidatus Pacebacteria bacterium]|nr:HemK family protein methyltransferase [Candidatus Paceibacterota bacterium]
MDLPEAYKTGGKDFLGIKIDLSKRPFIPREETEYWAGIAIEEIKQFTEKKKRQADCLDLFSGSGCIGVALLKKTAKANCDFGEADDNFLQQIKINLDLNEIDPKRYNLIKSDVFFGIDGVYDFIVANPPYVDEERIDEIGPDVKRYEPAIALMAGKGGMDHIKLFLEDAFAHLKKGGTIFMEMDEKQKKLIKDFLGSLPEDRKYSGFKFFKDQFGKYRFLKITK